MYVRFKLKYCGLYVQMDTNERHTHSRYFPTDGRDVGRLRWRWMYKQPWRRNKLGTAYNLLLLI